MASLVEEALKKIQNSDGVEGFIILNTEGVPIKSTIENSMAVQYAGEVQMLIEISRRTHHVNDATDELKNIRLRTKKNDLHIIIDDLYTMIVIQKPTGNTPPM